MVAGICIVVALCVYLWWYFTQKKKEDNPLSLGGPYSRQAVATDTDKCSEIGNNILNANGSAVDAAIAAMFCLGVINMQSSGVGGGGVMLVYVRKLKKAKVIDFRETAPAATTSDMFPPTESGKNMSKYGKWYYFSFYVFAAFLFPSIAVIIQVIVAEIDVTQQLHAKGVHGKFKRLEL